MSKDEKYFARTQIWRRYGLLFKDLMNTYGFERALQHHIDSKIENREDFIQSLKDKYPELTIENYGASIKERYMSSGYATEAKVTDNSVEITLGLCPFYDGFAQAGISHDIIKTVCEKGSHFEYDFLQRHYPEYEGIIEFRETAEDSCIEGFRLIK
jgi:hypothetical protein